MHLKLRYSVLFILLYLAYVISVFTAMFSGNKYSIDHMLLSMLNNHAVFVALVRPILKLEPIFMGRFVSQLDAKPDEILWIRDFSVFVLLCKQERNLRGPQHRGYSQCYHFKQFRLCLNWCQNFLKVRDVFYNYICKQTS